MAQYSELVTKIKADNSDFNKKIKEAKNAASSFAKSMASVGAIAATAIGVGAVGAFIKLLHTINETTDAVSALVDQASKFDTTVSQLQKLNFAAELVGVSAGDVDAAVTKLNKALAASQDDGSKAAKAFQDLGISAKSFASLSLEKQMLTLSTAFKQVGDNTTRNKLAFEIFGKSGLVALQLLKSGVSDAFTEFDKLGGSLSDKQAGAIDDYGDSVTKLKATFGVFAAQLTAAVAPALKLFIDFIQKSIIDMGGLGEVGKAVGTFVIEGVIGAVNAFQLLLDMLNQVKISFMQVKLQALEFRQSLNNANFAVSGGDIDFSRLDEIAKLRKQISAADSGNPDVTSGLVKGLENAKNAISTPAAQKIEVTVRAGPQFEVQIAQSNAVGMAIRTALATATSQEAQATGF